MLGQHMRQTRRRRATHKFGMQQSPYPDIAESLLFDGVQLDERAQNVDDTRSRYKLPLIERTRK
jgi:hypothetical protein